MEAKILDGKAVAQEVRDELKLRAEQFLAEKGRKPSLHAILVGDDPASHIYVSNKEKAAASSGFEGKVHNIPGDAEQEELESLVFQLSVDSTVDGIIVQLPLPKHLDAPRAIALLAPNKDVDGLHEINTGKLWAGKKSLRPCTPSGCIKLLEKTGVSLAGKHAVVVGRSALVGKPIAAMLLEKDCTVTIAHSKTENLAAVVGGADIVIAAVGKAEVVRGSWIKEGAIVIDVGINRMPDGKIKGDVEYAEASKRASWITPVPGGVGPMTIAMLLSNTLQAASSKTMSDSTIGY